MLRTAHGDGADAMARVETAPADELPVGIPAETRAERPEDRDAGGRFAPGNSLAARAAEGKNRRTRFARKLGLKTLPETAPLAPYMASAHAWLRAQRSELARTVGGGVCGPGPASVLADAAVALAWSRYFSDKGGETGDPDSAKLALAAGDRHRQAVLTAHELCAREAEAREKAAPYRAPTFDDLD